MAIDELLSRLEKVQSIGRDRFKACCPAHNDRSPSLSIKVADDRLLIHCFAGCSVHDVLDAVGLDIGDLFDKPQYHRRKPGKPQRASAADILRAVSLELTVVVMTAEYMHRNKTIQPDDVTRLYQAYQRINNAIDEGGFR